MRRKTSADEVMLELTSRGSIGEGPWLGSRTTDGGGTQHVWRWAGRLCGRARSETKFERCKDSRSWLALWASLRFSTFNCEQSESTEVFQAVCVNTHTLWSNLYLDHSWCNKENGLERIMVKMELLRQWYRGKILVTWTRKQEDPDLQEF